MVKVLNIIGKRPTGGIGAFTYNYQCHFTSDELKVDYLLFDDAPDGPFDEKVKKLGSTVYVLPALKNTRLISLSIQIDQFMKEIGKQYDVIHLHSVNIAFMCFPSARKYGVKHLISHSHATVYSDKPLNAIRNKYLCRNLMKYANVYMACSVAAGEFLYGKENMEQVIVLNNAIECEKFRFSDAVRDAYRKQLHVEDKFVIGNVGRFCEQKNQLFLMDIFAECLKKHGDSVLLLAGDGPLRGEVEAKAAKLGLTDHVSFLGTRDDIACVLQAFDVFVLPSLFEGLPVIGIEAQASGLPMVVSDAVTRELDLGDVSFVSLTVGLDAWVDAIYRCNRNTDRSEAYQKVSLLGYDIQREANKLQEFYLNLARSK